MGDSLSDRSLSPNIIVTKMVVDKTTTTHLSRYEIPLCCLQIPPPLHPLWTRLHAPECSTDHHTTSAIILTNSWAHKFPRA